MNSISSLEKKHEMYHDAHMKYMITSVLLFLPLSAMAVTLPDTDKDALYASIAACDARHLAKSSMMGPILDRFDYTQKMHDKRWAYAINNKFFTIEPTRQRWGYVHSDVNLTNEKITFSDGLIFRGLFEQWKFSPKGYNYKYGIYFFTPEMRDYALSEITTRYSTTTTPLTENNKPLYPNSRWFQIVVNKPGLPVNAKQSINSLPKPGLKYGFTCERFISFPSSTKK